MKPPIFSYAMKTICLAMCYDEELLIYKSLSHLYDLIDEFIIFEGTVSVFNDQPAHSTDNTLNEIKRFIKEKDHKGKCKLISKDFRESFNIPNRESFEAIVKNEMLKISNIQNGDCIFQLDTDEFWKPECFFDITELISKNEHINHVKIGEFQFAYSMKLYFPSSHEGRFLRWIPGSYYTASQHFFHPNVNKDLTKDHSVFIDEEHSNMYHLSYMKHPKLLRDKILSFKRPSHILWWNNVYLLYPFNENLAYKNNSNIPPYFGTGFCEGNNNRLRPYNGVVLDILSDIKDDWRQYIISNKESLII